tara:strand:+ start:4401 stop:10460 length:6060 start_codon:yes stop_codon:yes gene_type:complete
MDDDLLKLIERELIARLQRGERPDWNEYAERYPGDPDSLKKLFDTHVSAETIDHTKTPDRSVDSTVDSDIAITGELRVDDPWRTLDFVAGTAMENNLNVSGASREPSIRSSSGVLPRGFGDYQLLDELARGGMGVVFRARQIKLNRLVALKMILSGELAGEEQVKRFYAEAESAASLDHPGIVPVFEVGEHNGQHFFSMGLVEGKSLAKTVQIKTFSPRETVQMLAQIVDAVQYAHDRGVIHRDLKPANVLIDVTGLPRVTDFGLAKRVSGDSGMTASGQIMGTPSYMPPEQAGGRIEQIGVTADVYSLGAILYEMLVGRPPFRGTTPLETLRQVLESDPVPPSRLNPSVDRDLETICMKCLAKDRKERYPTAAALKAELDRYLDGRPIEARRLSATARTYRWCRRRPLQTGLIAASILLVATLIAFVVMSRRADRALQVSKLKSALTTQLSTTDASPQSIAGLETLIETLRIVDPAEADSANLKLTQGVATAIERNLRQSSIAGNDKPFREAIDWVRTRDTTMAKDLDASLLARLTDWRDATWLAMPVDQNKAEAAFERQTIRIVGDAIGRTETGKDRVLLTGECPSIAEIEVTFAGDWRNATRVGLLLNADEERGYEFAISTLDKKSEAASASRKLRELQPDDVVYLEVRKSGSVLQQRVISADKLPTHSISLRARRTRDQLSFQVELQEPLIIRDVFSSSSKSNEKFGLIWPTTASIVSLRTRMRDLPIEPRPIEQADGFLDNNKFAEAFEIYQQIARQSASPDDQAEANYKAAVCLLKMKRIAEASNLFDLIRKSRADPWGLLASCQRWLLHLQKKEFEKADLISDQLSAGYTFEQLAAAIPSEQRSMILDAFFSQPWDARSPSGLARIVRAMAIDRFMSIDGRGSLDHQEYCIKAIERAGHLDHAERLWTTLMSDFPTTNTAYYRLSMLARSNGDYDASLHYIETAFETFKKAGRTSPAFELLLEQIRTTSAKKQHKQSLKYLDEFRVQLERDELSQDESIDAKRRYWALLSHESLLRGFALDDLGRSDEAIAVWLQGYTDTREAIGRSDASEDWLTLNVLILGSLSGELNRDDIPGLLVILSGSSMPQQLAKIGISQIGEDAVYRTLLGMWQRPHAKQMARDGYALHLLSYKDRLALPIRLAGQEFFQQSAFSDELAEGQKQMVDKAVDTLISIIEAKKMGMVDLIGFAMAWKQPGDSGAPFESLVNRLPAGAKALASYLIAHRLSKLDKRENDIERWLERASEGGRDDRQIGAQVDSEREQLRSRQGVLTIANPLGRDVKIEWVGDDGVAVVKSLTESGTWVLPAGKYSVRTLDSSDAKVTSESVSIRPLSPQSLAIESRWAPGPEESSWPGMIIRPATLPGVKKWQLVTREPKSKITTVSASTDARLLAIGSRDGVLRIYRAKDNQLEYLLPGHARPLSSITWSEDGHSVLTTSIDCAIQLWQIPEARLVTSIRQAAPVIAGAISPDGSLFATGSYDRIIRIWNRDGTLHREYAAFDSRAQSLCWSEDGQQLISGDTNGKLCVWNMDDGEPEIQLHFDAPINLRPSTDRKQIAVWKAQGGTIELVDTKTWQRADSILTGIAGIKAVAWIDKGKSLAVLGQLGDIHIYDLKTLDTKSSKNNDASSTAEPVFVAKSDEANAIADFGNQQLVAVGNNGVARIWDVCLNPPGINLTSARRGVITMAWHPNTKLLTVACSDRRLRFFDLSGKQTHSLSCNSSPISTAWSGDGKNLAVSHWNKEIAIYSDDMATKTSLSPHTSPAFVAWTPQGDLVTANDSGEVRLYSDLSQPYQVIAKLDGQITSSLVAVPDELLFLSQRNSVTRISMSPPFSTRTTERANRVNAISWSNSTDSIAVTVGGAVEIFSVNDLAKADPKPLQTWRDGYEAVRSVAWSLEGQNLYSLIDDGRLLTRDRSGQVVKTQKTEKQLTPDNFAILPDDSVAVTGTDVPMITFNSLRANKAMFSVIMLDNDQSIKIYPGGFCNDALDKLDSQLVCVVMDESGVVSTRPPSQFFER